MARQGLPSQQCFQMSRGASVAFWLADSWAVTVQCMQPRIITDWHTPTEQNHLESRYAVFTQRHALWCPEIKGGIIYGVNVYFLG